MGTVIYVCPVCAPHMTLYGYRQLLYKVAEQRLVTVAVPALGTGGYGLSPRRVSVDMRDALACTPSFGSLKSIQFMDLNAHAMQEFDLSIQELVDPTRPRRNQCLCLHAGLEKCNHS